jgi:hypothetical protein
MRIHNLTRGLTFKMDRDMSKGQIINLCEDLESHLGPGHRIEPMPGKGLRWADWPGKAWGDALGGKEIRFQIHPTRPMSHVPWPVVEENARQLWRDDPSLALRQGWYNSQIVAYGTATKWTRLELELVRECFMRQGVRVSLVIGIRRLRYKGDALAKACVSSTTKVQ